MCLENIIMSDLRYMILINGTYGCDLMHLICSIIHYKFYNKWLSNYYISLSVQIVTE